MSLLNEMLNNLDTRRQSAVPDSEGLVVSPVEPQPKRWGLWVVALSVALGLIYVAERYQVVNFPGTQNAPVTKLHVVNAVAPIPDQDAKPVPANQPVPDVTASARIDANSSANTGMQTIPLSAAETPALQVNPMSEGVPETQEQITDQEQSVGEPVRGDNWSQQAAEEMTMAKDEEPDTTAPEQVMGQGAEYILRQSPDYHAVQLVALQDEARMLQYASEKGLDSPLYVKTSNKGINWYVLLMGIYPDTRTATMAIEQWSKSGKPSIKPWIRQLGPLQKMIVLPNPSMATDDQPDTTDQGGEVERLLEEAELALLRERLTSPAHDNAYDRYRRVLQLVPDHPIALHGIDRIIETYLKLAVEYRDSGNLERADWLIGKAKRVSTANPEIAAHREQLPTAKESLAPLNIPIAELNNTPAMESVEGEISVKQASGIAKREKDLLGEVENLLQQGAETEARRKLERFLVNHPGSPASVEVLFRLYLQMNKLDLATQLLHRSTQLPDFTAIKLGAQLQIKQGNLTGAVKMLEEGASHYQDASYSALQAGLYQKLGRYNEAVSLYRELLGNEPENGTYWLGLAVSLDSLQENQDARTAFQHTLDYGNYDGDVREYIEQRIQALSQ